MLEKEPYRRQENILTNVLRHAREIKAKVREEKWIEWVRSIDAHTSITDMWKNIRRVQGKQLSSTPTHPDPEGEADRLANGFARRTSATKLPIMTHNRLADLRPHRTKVIARACLEDSTTDTPLTMTELKASLKTGEDGITHTVIRNAGLAGHSAILALFSASWNEGRLPAEWKRANIIPIPKPKEPGNFRPISLLSCISERIANSLKQAQVGCREVALVSVCLHERIRHL